MPATYRASLKQLALQDIRQLTDLRRAIEAILKVIASADIGVNGALFGIKETGVRRRGLLIS